MSTTALLLQLIVILATARVCGWLLKHMAPHKAVAVLSAPLAER